MTTIAMIPARMGSERLQMKEFAPEPLTESEQNLVPLQLGR